MTGVSPDASGPLTGAAKSSGWAMLFFRQSQRLYLDASGDHDTLQA